MHHFRMKDKLGPNFGSMKRICNVQSRTMFGMFKLKRVKVSRGHLILMLVFPFSFQKVKKILEVQKWV